MRKLEIHGRAFGGIQRAISIENPFGIAKTRLAHLSHPKPSPVKGHIVTSGFRPAWWLAGAHAQTLWPTLTRPRPGLALSRRRIELADGDFIDLSVSNNSGPGVLIVHGLEGDLKSHYVASLMTSLAAAGFRPLFMHLRGCSSEPNRLARSYHSGSSDDLREVLAALARDPGGPPTAAIGISLGGNLLLKYLGERPSPHAGRSGSDAEGRPSTPKSSNGHELFLDTAIAISPPFVLRDAMLRLNQGVSRLYRAHLVRRIKRAFRRKFAHRHCPLSVNLDRIKDFNTFDQEITAPLCGFAGVFDYYSQSSCRGYLPAITTPTLILHARDDPFLFPTSVPFASELGPGVTLELSPRGGHVGFVAGRWPWRPEYWLETRILEHLEPYRPS